MTTLTIETEAGSLVIEAEAEAMEWTPTGPAPRHRYTLDGEPISKDRAEEIIESERLRRG